MTNDNNCTHGVAKCVGLLDPELIVRFPELSGAHLAKAQRRYGSTFLQSERAVGEEGSGEAAPDACRFENSRLILSLSAASYPSLLLNRARDPSCKDRRRVQKKQFTASA